MGETDGERDRPTPPARVPDWWPHVAHSGEHLVGALRWHLQRWPPPRPEAPLALLLHGTGAGTHSWRHIAPTLATRFEVLVVDLPGHAFTVTPASQALDLTAVAAAVGALLDALGRRPALLIGHSAGAAVALRMVLDGRAAPRLVVSINGALLPLQGPVGRLFLPLAKLLAFNPFVAPAFATWAALPRVTRRLLDSTGSRIDPVGERCYGHLVARASHAEGALRLMASWDLAPLAAALSRVPVPLLLLAATHDRTVPPAQSARVRETVPGATLVTLPGLGHLAHEEDAAAVLAPLLDAWAVAADIATV